jgi:hypothetical protein
MAVCNLFNAFDKKHSGNFMLFSQYVEDVTHNFSGDSNHKVVPSRFVALNIGDRYKNIVNPDSEPLNIAVPRYFQNYFENGCAYVRNYFSSQQQLNDANTDITSWNANVSKNLFWNSMLTSWELSNDEYAISNNGNNSLLTIEKTTIKDKEYDIVPQIKYWGDIHMQSYNEHNGMGYNELYCYIPSSSCLYKCAVSGDNITMEGIDNDNATIEGYNSDANISLSPIISNYPNIYCIDPYYETAFEDTLGTIFDDTATLYNIDTIVVLYDVMTFDNTTGKWNYKYRYIPMGMYICGNFDDNDNLTNTIKKFVTVSDETGTSYGLRICTRFTVAPHGVILQETEINTDSDNYVSMCQMMSGMAENLDKMFEITNSTINNLQVCKDELSILKNNRTNVPYIKTINGTDYWFVNGKLVSKVCADITIENEDDNNDQPPSGETPQYDIASTCDVFQIFGYDC